MAIFRLLRSDIDAIVGDFVNENLVVDVGAELTLEEAEACLGKKLVVKKYKKTSGTTIISGRVVILKKLLESDNPTVESTKVRNALLNCINNAEVDDISSMSSDDSSSSSSDSSDSSVSDMSSDSSESNAIP